MNMQPDQAIAIIKQALAAVNCEWESRVKIVEAMQCLEQHLVDLRTENHKMKSAANPEQSVD